MEVLVRLFGTLEYVVAILMEMDRHRRSCCIHTAWLNSLVVAATIISRASLMMACPLGICILKAIVIQLYARILSLA